MDLNKIELRRLLHEDRPGRIEKISDILKTWSGPMDEDVVHSLGNYLDPNKKSRWGAPKKSPPSYFVDEIVMRIYFDGINRNEPDPVQYVVSRFSWFKISKGRCTAFEQTRSRFNKHVITAFWDYLRYTDMTAEQVARYLQDSRDIPTVYWDECIQSKF